MWILRTLPVLILVALVTATSAQAQILPVGAESQIPANPAGFQSAPAMAVAPSGASLVVWQSAGGWGGQEADIWARGYGSDGVPLTPEFLVNSSLPGCQTAPDVAAAPDGTFTVVWQSDGQDGDGSGVFARRLAADGTLLGPEIQVHETTADDQRAPRVAHDPAGNYMVVWESDGQDGDGGSIIARRFGASGPLSSETVIPSITAGDQRRPDVAFQPTGHAVFLWQGPDGDGSGIFLRRFEGSLAGGGPEVRANASAVGFQSFPALGTDASGNVIAVWEQAAPGVPNTTIQALRFGRFLTPVGDEVRLDAGSPGPASRPVVESAASGDFLVLWESWGVGQGGPEVLGRVFDFLEQPAGPAAPVHDFHPGRQSRPGLAGNPAGSILASWISLGQDGDGSGVFARRFAVLGRDFHAVEPCRIIDTRTGSPLTSGVERLFQVDGACGIPYTARALAINLTAILATASGNISLFPGDAAPPVTSSINFPAGATRANNAILPLARNGTGTFNARASVAGGGQVHLIIDVSGYFE